MPGLLDESGFLLFAQEAGNTGAFSSLLLILPIPFLFYFLIWQPQQKQEKKRRALIDSLKKNEKIITAGGIYGTVVSVDPAGDKLVLRIDDDKGVKMTISRSSVMKVLETTEKGTEGS
jgi:preprotein translocase subunit YajC